MSDERKISRRASLRGIAATGAIISGTGLSVGTVGASEKKADQIQEVDFKDCHSVAVHLKKDVDELPITIRAYNADKERIENIQQTITKRELLPYKLWKAFYDGDNHKHELEEYDDHDKKDGYDAKCLCGEHDEDHEKKDDRKRVWTFDVYQFYDRAIDAEDKILSVKVGGERIKNTNDCAKKYSHDYDKKGEIDTEDIGLVAICVNSKTNTARFRVDNWNKKKVTVEYDVFNTGRGGEVKVEPMSTTYFDVEASGSGGEATVRLFYEGEQIDVKASNTQRECLAKEKIAFSVNDVDYSKRKVEFYLHDGTDFDRTFNYYDSVTGAAGTITVHDDPASAETFWLDAPRCKASVKLYYQGHVVAKAETDNGLDGPVVNKTQRESFETIQAAVDEADEGDTIVVCEDEDLGRDQVTIDVEGLTLKGFDKPTVRLGHDGQNPGFPVFNVVADDVTIKGFHIERVLTGTNDGGERAGQGIKIGGFRAEGGDNAMILNNKIELIDEQDPANDETDNNVMFGVAVIEPENGDPIETAKIAGNKIKNFDVEPYEGSIEDAGIAIFDGQEEVILKKNKLKDNECGILFLEDLEDNIEFDDNEFDDNGDDFCPIDPSQ